MTLVTLETKSRAAATPASDPAAFPRPYVISWNLTYRCNLACEHCYLDAGPRLRKDDPAFADRGELDTDQCRGVIDQIAELAPEALTILTGGEPLLRRDILDIVRYADQRELWVVVGTNGVLITETLAERLQAEGVRGLSLSLDALDAETHDRFRRVRGAWQNTVAGARVLHSVGLPFIVQTTVGAHNLGDLEAIARLAHEELGAKVWNLYFLVPTGRGEYVSDVSPEEYDQVLETLSALQRRYSGEMVVNAKCAPHYVKQLLAEDAGSPFLKSFGGGAGGCPAGTHYLGIRPNGEITPCPYLPVFAGNVRETSLEDVWRDSNLFRSIRRRDQLGGRCGDCELSGLCGGCRARAYGATGDLLAADPLCTHTPGRFTEAVRDLRPALEYGTKTEAAENPEVAWDAAAEERMKRVPAFVRGMVMRRVEDACRRQGSDRITVEMLEEIRSRMPTPKIFGKGS